MASLRDKTISGFFWSLLQKVGSNGIGFVIMILLARILAPADFGLIGMLAIFIALSQTLVQAGFSQALIQKKDTDEEDYSSVFYINLVVSVTLYIILFFCAPLISDFYDQPKLTALTRVLSLVFVINAFGYVQETRLKKSLDFKKLMYVHLPSTLISGVVAVIMAFMGYGVWSIVAQRLVMRFAFTVQLWVYAKWKPLSTFNRQKASVLFSFGSKLMVSGIIHTVFDNLYQIVIGRFFPVQMLGYYENADKLTKTPTSTISSVLNSVAFPAFSIVQDNNKKLRSGYKKIMQQVLFWLCPILTIAGVLAEPLFRFVLGEKWMPAVPFFQIFCVSRVFSPLTAYNLSLLNIKGRSDMYLKLEIIKKTILGLGVIVAIPLGIYPLVIFRAIYGIFAYFINSYYSGRFIGYSTWKQLRDVSPIFILSLIMGIAVYFINNSVSNLEDFLRLFIGSVSGIIIYSILAIKLNFEPYLEFRNIFDQKFKKVFNLHKK